MGYRLYVAKKHEVEYGNRCGFNYESGQFENLLDCMDVQYRNNGDDYEVSEDEYKKALDILDNLDKDRYVWDRYQVDVDDVTSALDNLNDTREYVISLLHDYYDEADKRDGYLHFSFM